MEKLLKEKAILEQKIKDAIDEFFIKTNAEPIITIKTELVDHESGQPYVMITEVKSKVLI